MKKTLITLATATIAFSSANAQTFTGFSRVAFDNTAVTALTNTGTFTTGDLGAITGNSDFNGFTVTVTNASTDSNTVFGVNGTGDLSATASAGDGFAQLNYLVNNASGLSSRLLFQSIGFLSQNEAITFINAGNADTINFPTNPGFTTTGNSIINTSGGPLAPSGFDITLTNNILGHRVSGGAGVGQPGRIFVDVETVAAVPEPSSALLLGLSALGFFGRRKR